VRQQHTTLNARWTVRPAASDCTRGLADGEETMCIPIYLIQEVVAPVEDKSQAA
jgi:hypothetical protein